MQRAADVVAATKGELKERLLRSHAYGGQSRQLDALQANCSTALLRKSHENFENAKQQK
eukprot:COSAG02_NODE_155_length_33066_cov_32.167562_26_plen_59_part_00